MVGDCRRETERPVAYHKSKTLGERELETDGKRAKHETNGGRGLETDGTLAAKMDETTGRKTR